MSIRGSTDMVLMYDRSVLMQVVLTTIEPIDLFRKLLQDISFFYFISQQLFRVELLVV